MKNFKKFLVCLLTAALFCSLFMGTAFAGESEGESAEGESAQEQAAEGESEGESAGDSATTATAVEAPVIEATGDHVLSIGTYSDNFYTIQFDPYGFNKSKESLVAIRTPRFYACAVYGGGYGTLGGIKADPEMQVLDPEGNVIPGFYAGGNEVCTLYCGTYNMDMPGNSMGFAINSGRIAGENAADFVNGLEK